MSGMSGRMLRSVATRAKARLDELADRAFGAVTEGEVALLRARCDDLQVKNDVLSSDLQLVQRHRQEFFELIERIEKQRDEWREMFKRSAMEQMTALSIVDRALARERRRNAWLVKRLNEYLEKDGKEPIDEKRLSEQDAPPAGEYKRYAESMMKLFVEGTPEAVGRPSGEHRPPDIDGVSERDGAVK